MKLSRLKKIRRLSRQLRGQGTPLRKGLPRGTPGEVKSRRWKRGIQKEIDQARIREQILEEREFLAMRRRQQKIQRAIKKVRTIPKRTVRKIRKTKTGRKIVDRIKELRRVRKRSTQYPGPSRLTRMSAAEMLRQILEQGGDLF